MADLVITASSVAATSGIQAKEIAGETITAGMPVYKHTDGKLYKATCEDASALKAVVVGISLHASLANQPLVILTASGSIATMNPGATVAVGQTYVLSETGLIAPISDLASSDYVTLLYFGLTASSVQLLLTAYGVEKP